MFLTEVHLRNWRSYRNATFSFPRPEVDKSNKAKTKKVILVGAQNGTGKTSLLIALYLGLFGREAMHLIEGVRISGAEDERWFTYRNLIQRTLHRPAQRKEDSHALVRLKFESEDGEQIVIRRKWGFTRAGKIRDLNTRDGEEVIVEMNGQTKLFPSWQDANDRISEILFPSNVMPCFFFDGEQAQERVEAASKGALLDAVNTLYGTGILGQLRQSLGSFIRNERSALKRDVGNVKLDELEIKREELDKAKLARDQIRKSLTDKKREQDDLENERQQLASDLYQLVGDSGADINEYAESIKAYQTEQIRLRSELTNGLASLALPLALAKNDQLLIDTLTAEQIRDRWLLLKEEATGKASRIVDKVLPQSGSSDIQPPLQKVQADRLRGKLEQALETLWSPPPTGCAEEYRFTFLHESDRTAVISKVSSKQALAGINLQDVALEWNSINAQLRETERKFNNIRDIQPKLLELKKAIEGVGKKIADISGEVNKFELQEEGVSRRINDLLGSIGQMETKRRIVNPVQEKLDLAYKVNTVVDEAQEKLIPLCQNALEKRCTYHFTRMISDEYKKFKVRFDPDTEPRLENGSRVVYVTGLSGAQKRAFGLAFTLAVADVSNQNAPIIVDTPVGNMDSKYRDRVLKHVAEAAPGQVVFLSHDEEISEEYKSKLSQYVRKTYLLDFKQVDEGCGETTIIDDKYFGDN
ncbi:AAA family ATPase [Pseudodesulfovibrio thermohalotolerans]|uniref:AAA family ATPase n=1 Tax=Pseudodesulfovibrio thermohalotolerans TaxID=2880651 RepID=UPI0024414E6D|nr:AAA family ATPase [Pseudodesulfovibrio thermohalotolerans]WFS63397.1 AAA family ATPase [Pseudodesulfovibrio thermohalotolerans]